MTDQITREDLPHPKVQADFFPPLRTAALLDEADVRLAPGEVERIRALAQSEEERDER